MTTIDKDSLLLTLRDRFEKNSILDKKIDWIEIESRLLNHGKALKVLQNMEETGGEPEVVQILDDLSVVFMDASKETPKGRRNCCYDQEARLGRKKFPPEVDAISLANEMGATLLNEEDYHLLQSMFDVDLKSSSWILTPTSIRNLGGAIFGDKRYGRTFIYHNGSDSYYGSRGFRTKYILEKAA